MYDEMDSLDNNDMNEELVKVPTCRSCGHAMIWSSIFPSCYACIPCITGEPMSNGRPKVTVTRRSQQAKRQRWGMDIHAYHLLTGGNCAAKEPSECEFAEAHKPDYEFKYLGKRKWK